MDVRLVALLLIVGFFQPIVNADKLKICVVESVHTSKRVRGLCPRLVASGSQVECVIGNDRFNCLRRVTTGNVDFTVLEPEDLVAAALYNEYNILVTNELRLFPEEKQRFEMVALVHKNVKNIWDIKGRRFCHPGFETNDEWSNAFSTYFENWIIPKECNPEKTLLENRIAGLSGFFDAACIAGPWSADANFDNQLKSRYKNLCSLCDNPAGCYTSDKYHGREGALLCLTDNMGDVAWVRLDDTLEHFKDEQINKEDYSYLCPDGTTRPVGFKKPCVWITKPWPVVVARSEMAEKVSKMMASLKMAKFEWETILRQLMETYHPTPVSTDTLETPEDFLRRFPGFMSANNRATCRPSRRVQWCVASNLEFQKCRWLREASFVYGIEPTISCVQESTRVNCLEEVKNNRTDIFVAKPEELLNARKKGLMPIVEAVPKKKEEINRIAAVVKQDSRFKNLKDLKGAKACFTGYRDVGWNAFVSVIRNVSGVSSDCSDAKIISDFFQDSCVLGLSDKDEDIAYNLYSLCKQAGSAGDDVSAFDCLTSGLGDVAFVNLKVIEKKTGTLSQGRGEPGENKKYRTLCLSNTDADYDNTCLLTWTALSTIIANENMTSLRREEIYSMLLEMDQLFGQTIQGQTSAFSLYGMYDSNRNVMFPEETQHLQFKGHQIQRVRNYNDIVDDIVKQAPCSSASLWDYGNTIALHISIILLTKLLSI